MTTEADLSVADRLAQVLDHLGIERAHFAASMLADVTGFAKAHPERIASLTLVCPPRLDPSTLGALSARLVIIAGDQGSPAAMVPSREEPPRGYGSLASWIFQSALGGCRRRLYDEHRDRFTQRHI